MPKISGYETADVRLVRQQRRKDKGPGPRKLPRKLVGFADRLGGWRMTAQNGPIQSVTESPGGREGELRFSRPSSPSSAENFASQLVEAEPDAFLSSASGIAREIQYDSPTLFTPSQPSLSWPPPDSHHKEHRLEDESTNDPAYNINDSSYIIKGTKDTFPNFNWPMSGDYSTTYNNHTPEGYHSASLGYSSYGTSSFPSNDSLPTTNMLSYNDSGLSHPYQQSRQYNTHHSPPHFGIQDVATPSPLLISPSHPSSSHSFSPFQHFEPVCAEVSHYPSDRSLPERSLLFGEARNIFTGDIMTGGSFPADYMANGSLPSHSGFYSSSDIQQPSPLMELTEISTSFSQDLTATSTALSLPQTHARKVSNNLERTGHKHLSPYNAMTLENDSFYEYSLPEDLTQPIFSAPTPN